MTSHTSSATTATADADQSQSIVVTSLCNQVGDLVSQVAQLNSELRSHNRISDLENRDSESSAARKATLKISQLELERTTKNTGLLVEKAHVTSEETHLTPKKAKKASKAPSKDEEGPIDVDEEEMSVERIVLKKAVPELGKGQGKGKGKAKTTDLEDPDLEEDSEESKDFKLAKAAEDQVCDPCRKKGTLCLRPVMRRGRSLMACQRCRVEKGKCTLNGAGLIADRTTKRPADSEQEGDKPPKKKVKRSKPEVDDTADDVEYLPPKSLRPGRVEISVPGIDVPVVVNFETLHIQMKKMTAGLENMTVEMEKTTAKFKAMAKESAKESKELRRELQEEREERRKERNTLTLTLEHMQGHLQRIKDALA